MAKKEEMVYISKAAEDLIYLASCAVNEVIPDKARVEKMDLDAVYDMASFHMISACIARALESAGFRDKRSSLAISTALMSAVGFENEFAAIEKEFKRAGIRYSPLKGMVLKDYYPVYGMREMVDYDMLIDPSRADEIKEIMEGFGYTADIFGRGHHDVYHKPPYYCFEMHRALATLHHGKTAGDYYKNMTEITRPEDFYLFVVFHEFRHFVEGGIGLKPLLDIYVYLKKENLDWEYVEKEAEKLGIRDFEKENRKLAMAIFSDKKVSDKKVSGEKAIDLHMLSYILSCGSFGSEENEMGHRIQNSGNSKLQYIVERFKIPINENNYKYVLFAHRYPFFYEHKALLPLLPFYRIGRSIVEGNFVKEASSLARARKIRSGDLEDVKALEDYEKVSVTKRSNTQQSNTEHNGIYNDNKVKEVKEMKRANEMKKSKEVTDVYDVRKLEVPITTRVKIALIKSAPERTDYIIKHNLFAEVGRNFIFQPRIVPINAKLIKIHNDVAVASGTIFVNHDAIQRSFSAYRPDKHVNKRYGCIEIMDNVFIGSNSIIMYDVKIGPNAVVAAGSVVTKDVPEGCIVGGNPAKVIGTYDALFEKRYKESQEMGAQGYTLEDCWKRFDEMHKDKK